MKLEQPHKDLVIDRLDLIRHVTYILTHESNPAMLCSYLKLIEICFYNCNIEELNDLLLEQEELGMPITNS
jgi:hypothetical protein